MAIRRVLAGRRAATIARAASVSTIGRAGPPSRTRPSSGRSEAGRRQPCARRAASARARPSSLARRLARRSPDPPARRVRSGTAGGPAGQRAGAHRRSVARHRRTEISRCAVENGPHDPHRPGHLALDPLAARFDAARSSPSPLFTSRAGAEPASWGGRADRLRESEGARAEILGQLQKGDKVRGRASSGTSPRSSSAGSSRFAAPSTASRSRARSWPRATARTGCPSRRRSDGHRQGSRRHCSRAPGTSG